MPKFALRFNGGPAHGSTIQWKGERLPMEVKVLLERVPDGLDPSESSFVSYQLTESIPEVATYELFNEPEKV